MSALASDCAVKPAIAVRPKKVSVNGSEIPREAIARETQNHPARKPIDAWQAAARSLVVRELLLQEARRLQIKATPLEDEEGRRETDEEALVRGLVEQEVRTPQAGEDACRRYYDMNRARFRSADLYEARHILLVAVPGDVAARKKALEEARVIIADLRRDPSKFGAVARAFSACPSGQTDGILGQIGPGQTVPEFERAMAAAPLSEVAPEPVETRYGFHILLVDHRLPGRELPFELAQERIAAWLEEKVHRTAVRQFISVLAGRAEIVGVDLATSGPLVQ